MIAACAVGGVITLAVAKLIECVRDTAQRLAPLESFSRKS